MMEGKNVLYICDYAASYTGNFIASLSALAEKVREKNNVYFLLPRAASRYDWVNNLPADADHILWCDFSFCGLRTACKELAKKLGNRNTVVHTHFVADLFLLAVRASFSNVICHYHMTVPVCYNLSKKAKRMVRRMIYHGAVMVGVSEAVTEDIRAYFHSKDCECIPNAIDFVNLDKCSAGTAAPEFIRDSGKFRILIHGTDFYRKGVDLAAAVVEGLNREHQNGFSLYVTTHDAEYAKMLLEGNAADNGSIVVMKPVENIKQVYDTVELFISPSREEAFGYAVVEAAYSGCQVAASDIPGQNTMKPVPGILWFEKDDVEGLKQAILQARENAAKGQANAIKEAQRAFVVQNFRIEKWVEQNMAVYDKYFG